MKPKHSGSTLRDYRKHLTSAEPNYTDSQTDFTSNIWRQPNVIGLTPRKSKGLLILGRESPGLSSNGKSGAWDKTRLGSNHELREQRTRNTRAFAAVLGDDVHASLVCGAWTTDCWWPIFDCRMRAKLKRI